ncbi:uncharacterized protein METZ01_LOCUS182312 [marine metagenome]|uniref:DUF3576 domain-containing protein n=1 Tax=marine metagenome TaxID=408172 RepID=A0A382CTH2_9ZZZZ
MIGPNLNLIKPILPILFLLSFLLTSCGMLKPSDARKVSPNVDERVQQAIQEGRGFRLGSGIGKGGTNFEFASSNELWRASLEVLDFLPLSNVDYSGGIIITEWYSEGTSNDEAIKITVRFLSNEIRADGLSVIIHKRVCNKFQQCTTAKIKSTLEEEVKLAILKTATLLEKGKYKKNKEEYIKKYGDKEPKRPSKKHGNN